MCRDIKESGRERAIKHYILALLLVGRGGESWNSEEARGVIKEAWGEPRGLSVHLALQAVARGKKSKQVLTGTIF